MEADWEIEIGPHAPVIDVDWADRIDLVREPHRVLGLPEVKLLPLLAPSLIQFNAKGAGWSTSKCDVWDVEQFDRDELNAPLEAAVAMACYIDIVPDERERVSLERTVDLCRRLCTRLHEVRITCCRVDFVIRRAVRACPADAADASVAITVYVTACGKTRPAVETILGESAVALADAVFALATPPEST
jgi:hypothetical protein